MRSLKKISLGLLLLLVLSLMTLLLAILLLRYQANTLLPHINTQLQTYQLRIEKLDIRELAWRKTEIAALQINHADQGRISLADIELHYSVLGRQLRAVNIARLNFDAKVSPPAASQSASTFKLDDYLSLWRDLPPLEASVQRGQINFAGQSAELSFHLQHGKLQDTLKLEVHNRDFSLSTELRHRWDTLSLIELLSTRLLGQPNSPEPELLIDIPILNIQQQQHHFDVHMQAETKLAASFDALKPWLGEWLQQQVVQFEPQRGQLALTLEGQLQNDLLDLPKHKLAVSVQAVEAPRFLVQLPASSVLAASVAEVELSMPQAIRLNWQQGLQLQSGELGLDIKHPIASLSGHLQASDCQLDSCRSRYSMQLGAGSWSDKTLDARWQGMQTQGQARWHNNRLMFEGSWQLDQFQLNSGELKLLPLNAKVPSYQGRVDTGAGPLSAVLNIPGLNLGNIVIRQDQLSAYASFSLQNIKLDYAKDLALSGDYQLLGIKLRAAKDRIPETQLTGSWSLAGQALSFEGALSSDNSAPLMSFTGEHQLNKKKGSAELKSTLKAFDTESQKLSKRFGFWAYDMDLLGGTIESQTQLSWSMVKNGAEGLGYSVNSNLKLDNVAAVYQDIIVLGLSYDGQLAFDGQQWNNGSQPGQLSLRQLDVGLPLNDIAAQISVSGASPTVRVEHFKAHLLKGLWQFDDFSYQLGSTKPQPLNMKLRQLQLEDLVSSAQYQGLEAKASISGDLPLLITGSDITMDNGLVYADKPGYIRYTGLQAGDNQLVGIVSQALSNYHFAKLRSTAVYQRDGNLDLAIRMEGENPDMQQKVNVNLNLNYDIPSLLKSLRAGRVVSDMIESKLNTEKL